MDVSGFMGYLNSRVLELAQFKLAHKDFTLSCSIEFVDTKSGVLK